MRLTTFCTSPLGALWPSESNMWEQNVAVAAGGTWLSKVEHFLRSPSVSVLFAVGAAQRSRMLLLLLLLLLGWPGLVRLTIFCTASLGVMWLQWDRRIEAQGCCGCWESLA